MERKKAMEALQKAADKSSDVFKKPHQVSANKENMKSLINGNGSTTDNSMRKYQNYEISLILHLF